MPFTMCTQQIMVAVAWSFSDRLRVSVFRYRDYFTLPKINEMNRRYFGPDSLPLEALAKRAALTLVNIHPAFDSAQPLPPNVIAIGGVHIEPAKALPADLEAFISQAKQGAVFFAFGTNINSDWVSREQEQKFLDVFRLMPNYRFVWKYERALADLALPDNVLVRKWLPQADILAHPNVRAFITHSGLLSTQEAMWHAVPMLAIPFCVDQPLVNGRAYSVLKSKALADKFLFHRMR